MAAPKNIAEYDQSIRDLQAQGKDTSVLLQNRNQFITQHGGNPATAPAAPNPVALDVTPTAEEQAQARAAGNSVATTIGNDVNAVIDAGKRGIQNIGNGINYAATAVGNAVSNAPATVSNAASSAASTGKSWWDSIKEFFGGVWKKIQDFAKDANWKELLGAGAGVGVAWLVSSMLGNGIIGWLAFGLLAVGCGLMGRDFAKNTFGSTAAPAHRSGGNSPQPAQPCQAQAQAQAPQGQAQTGADAAPAQTGAVAAPAQTGAVAAPVALTATPAQQLQDEIAQVGEKSVLAQQILAAQVQMGQRNPREAERSMRQIGETQGMIQQMQQVNLAMLDGAQVTAIDRQFRHAETQLDRVINSDAVTAARIQQQSVVSAPQYAPVFAGPQPATAVGAVFDPRQVQYAPQAMMPQGQFVAAPVMGPQGFDPFAGVVQGPVYRR